MGSIPSWLLYPSSYSLIGVYQSLIYGVWDFLVLALTSWSYVLTPTLYMQNYPFVFTLPRYFLL